ncbi:Acetyltransferase, GNAT family [hydrothermal vent metagenome]|uniref:Acetyltransferase, GNAT family n=1 Tax=hydrothermal vent metagenome TaxID=652676 RepID=A0A3B1AVZ0_9ZZZZ
MKLRLATKDDIPLIEYWDRQPHVINSGGDDDHFDWEFEISRQTFWQEILIAEIKGVALGVIQIIDPENEETHYWGNVESNLRAIDIWIGEAKNLGKGFGTQMMHLALEKCFTDEKIKAVIIDPLTTNIRAIKFYQKIGF